MVPELDPAGIEPASLDVKARRLPLPHGPKDNLKFRDENKLPQSEKPIWGRFADIERNATRHTRLAIVNQIFLRLSIVGCGKVLVLQNVVAGVYRCYL